MANFKLVASMTWSGRWAHNDVAVAVRFDAALDLGQLRIGEQFGPTTQVEGRLRLVLRKLDGQCRHARKLAFGQRARQGRQWGGMLRITPRDRALSGKIPEVLLRNRRSPTDRDDHAVGKTQFGNVQPLLLFCGLAV